MNIETSLNIEYGLHWSKLEVAGTLTSGLALQFDRMLTVLRDYYGYHDIKLIIHSPGGQLLALQHMLAALGRWRAGGGRVATHATMETGSAAALLLSMGDVGKRTAQPHTQLLFHHTRIVSPADSNLTAASSATTAQSLMCFDRALVARVAEHLQGAHGGAMALGHEGLNRCKALSERFCEVAHALGVDPERREPVWLKEASLLFDRMTIDNQLGAYARKLDRRFGRDQRMDLREAWVLQLIDGIEGVPALSRRAHIGEPVPHCALAASGSSGARSVSMNLCLST